MALSTCWLVRAGGWPGRSLPEWHTEPDLRISKIVYPRIYDIMNNGSLQIAIICKSKYWSPLWHQLFISLAWWKSSLHGVTVYQTKYKYICCLQGKRTVTRSDFCHLTRYIRDILGAYVWMNSYTDTGIAHAELMLVTCLKRKTLRGIRTSSL